MVDSRVSDYATLLVERCVDVQPGWEVLVIGSTQARPLVEEVVRAIGRRKAVPVLQLSFSGMDFWPFETVWAETAPAERAGGKVIDLMAALEKSVRAAQEARGEGGEGEKEGQRRECDPPRHFRMLAGLVSYDSILTSAAGHTLL